MKFPICLLADDLRVLANIGSLFRLVDALGVDKIYLGGTSPIPPSTKIRRTSRSTDTLVDFEHAPDPVKVARRLKREGFRVVSLEPTPTSVGLLDFAVQPEDKICLVLGAERTGIRPELLELSDATVHIPMLGENASMNVAMACAIATFHLGQLLNPR